MTRILGIELRRSAAPGTALAVLLGGVALLFLVDPTMWTGGWLQLAMTQRLFLVVLWPLALAAGAWQARRDHRSNVAELFASTPRPRAHRTVPALGAMAIAVVCGYLAMGVTGGLWIIGTARYLPVSVFAVTAVGALALIAAAWLGLAVGRLLPWVLTASALAVAGLGLLLLLPGATRPRGWLALVFSPIYEMNMPGAYTTVPGRASAAQAIWLAALAIAAVLLFAARDWRTKVAALLPVVVGAAAAITVMPRQSRLVTDAIDPVAKEMVCAAGQPRVCVSRSHAGLLSEVAPYARDGLAFLAKLPDPPNEVHEDTTTYLPDAYPPWQPHVVLLPVDTGKSGHLADRAGVPLNVVDRAFDSPPRCENSVDPAERIAAASWLIGRAPENRGRFGDPAIVARAVTLWRGLQELPGNEALARVVALRSAAAQCRNTGGQLSRSSQ